MIFSIQDIVSNGYTVEFLDLLSVIAVLFGITVCFYVSIFGQ